MMFGFDVVIVVTTLTFGFKASRSLDSSKDLLRAVTRDVILYFLFIFGMNLFWVLCILYARIGLKNLALGPTVVLTSVMIARLALSLHKAHRKDIARPNFISEEYELADLSTVIMFDPSFQEL